MELQNQDIESLVSEYAEHVKLYGMARGLRDAAIALRRRAEGYFWRGDSEIAEALRVAALSLEDDAAKVEQDWRKHGDQRLACLHEVYRRCNEDHS